MLTVGYVGRAYSFLFIVSDCYHSLHLMLPGALVCILLEGAAAMAVEQGGNQALATTAVKVTALNVTLIHSTGMSQCTSASVGVCIALQTSGPSWALSATAMNCQAAIMSGSHHTTFQLKELGL